MTSLDPTSRCAMRPSGETLDLVKPGMSRVVGRIRGVEAVEVPIELVRVITGLRDSQLAIDFEEVLGGAEAYAYVRLGFIAGMLNGI